MPPRVAVAVVVAVCDVDSACLPLTTTAPISGGASCDDSLWIRLSAAALVASEDCEADGACVAPSVTVTLANRRLRRRRCLGIRVGCCAAHKRRLPRRRRTSSPVRCNPDRPHVRARGHWRVDTGAWIRAVDECAASHANTATPQTPTVANTPTATAALRNHMVGVRGLAPRGADRMPQRPRSWHSTQPAVPGSRGFVFQCI